MGRKPKFGGDTLKANGITPGLFSASEMLKKLFASGGVVNGPDWTPADQEAWNILDPQTRQRLLYLERCSERLKRLEHISKEYETTEGADFRMAATLRIAQQDAELLKLRGLITAAFDLGVAAEKSPHKLNHYKAEIRKWIADV